MNARPVTPPPLTVEEQLRIVADTWLSADDRNRCVWEQEADALLVLFSYVDPAGGSRPRQRPRLCLTLRLQGGSALVVLVITAWTWAGGSIPLEVQTVEHVAAWLQLEIDWKDFEPF